MAESSTLEHCTHRRLKLTLLHLFTDLFRKDFFPHSLEFFTAPTMFNINNIFFPHSLEYLQGYYDLLYTCSAISFIDNMLSGMLSIHHGLEIASVNWTEEVLGVWSSKLDSMDNKLSLKLRTQITRMPQHWANTFGSSRTKGLDTLWSGKFLIEAKLSHQVPKTATFASKKSSI